MLSQASRRIIVLLGFSSVVHAGVLLAYGYLSPVEPAVQAGSVTSMQLQLLQADPLAALSMSAQPSESAGPLVDRSAVDREAATQASVEVLVTASDQAAFQIKPPNEAPSSVPIDPVQQQRLKPAERGATMRLPPAVDADEPSVTSSQGLPPAIATTVKHPVQTAKQPVPIAPFAFEPIAAETLLSEPSKPQSSGVEAYVESAPAQNARSGQSGSVALAQLQRRVGRQLLSAFEQYFSYPLKARRKGWQGEVLLAVELSERGAVRAVQVLQSSGYQVLDRAALLSMRKVVGIEMLALPGALSVEVPVSYRLLN